MQILLEDAIPPLATVSLSSNDQLVWEHAQKGSPHVAQPPDPAAHGCCAAIRDRVAAAVGVAAVWRMLCALFRNSAVVLEHGRERCRCTCICARVHVRRAFVYSLSTNPPCLQELGLESSQARDGIAPEGCRAHSREPLNV